MAEFYPYGLDVKIISGANMIKMDVGGKSDPYVVLSYDEDPPLCKTRVINNNQNPIWDQEFELDRPRPSVKKLRFTVFDEDFGKDDCMGMAELTLGPSADGTQTLRLIPKPGTNSYNKQQKNKDKLGTMVVAVKRLTAPRASAADYCPYGLDVRIISGANMIKMDAGGLGKSDPYVVLSYEDDVQLHKTRVVNNNNQNPVWNEEFELDRPRPSVKKLWFTVFDDDPATPDDCMGMAELKLGPGADGTHTLRLIPKPGTRSYNKQQKNIDKLGTLQVAVNKLTAPRASPTDYFAHGLDVRIISGANMIKMDTLGKSDPYVVLAYDDDDKQLHKTRVINNNQNPVWNQDFKLDRPRPSVKKLRFTVFDDDFGKDDCMGMAELKLGPSAEGTHTLRLIPKPGTNSYNKQQKNIDKLGTLQVTVKKRPAPPIYRPKPGGMIVDLDIHYASSLADTDLVGDIEPYVKVFYVSAQSDDDMYVVAQTPAMRGRDPAWTSASYTLHPPLDERELLLQVWDKDVGSDNDDFLGQAVLPLNIQGKQQILQLQPRHKNERDRKLAAKYGTLGALCVSTRVKDPHNKPPPPKPKPEYKDPVIPPRPRKDSALELGTVLVTVVRAYGLARADGGPKEQAADPYVVVQFDGDRNVFKKTEVKPNTRAPVWNEKLPPFSLPRNAKNQAVLKFTVMDYDMLKRNDFMGMAFLTLGLGMDGLHQLCLLPHPNADKNERAMMKDNQGSLGTLEVEVTSHLDAGFAPFHKTGIKLLHVQVEEAFGLPEKTDSRKERKKHPGKKGGMSPTSLFQPPPASRDLHADKETPDPYVTLSFGKRPPAAFTSWQQDTTHPRWYETFQVPVPPTEGSLTVSVWDHDDGSTDDLIGEARVPLTGHIVGRHTLTLGRKGQDERRKLGSVRINIIRTDRLYAYDDEDDRWSDVSSESDASDHREVKEQQPVSWSIEASNNVERQHKLAELWRRQDAQDAVYLEEPLSPKMQESEEAQRKAARDNLSRLKAQTERMRLLREKEEYDLLRQREELAESEIKDKLQMLQETDRVLELVSYNRVSLKLGGTRGWNEDVVVVPDYFDPHYQPHYDPTRPPSAPSSPTSKRHPKYRSPYKPPNQLWRPQHTPRPPPKKSKNPPKPLPKLDRHVRAKRPDETDEDYKNSMGIMLRDYTPISHDPPCKTDYHFTPDGRDKKSGVWQTHDPRHIGHKSREKGIPFEKMSLGRASPFASRAKEE